MNPKIQPHHREKPAYVYLRQSSLNQVRYHQESTERQYALQEHARQLGWPPEAIRVLDGDLGLSGATGSRREDFNKLVAEVSLRRVGAVFALEVSRLARSSADWHRLLELCALTDTLIIDEDGCYNLTDFNDQLLLGLKGTMSQAELHWLRARLQGGKLHKAQKGELRVCLPVGFCYDDEGRTIQDPDAEVRGAIQLLFATFREAGSAYGVVRTFVRLGLQFPKRAYGGVWDGRVLWGRLSHHRVLEILHNPAYAGVYVYGRYRDHKEILPDGTLRARVVKMPAEAWRVTLPDHHEAYLSWEEFQQNQLRLEQNRTNGEEHLLSGPAREGLALLQGLLLCHHCGRRLSVRYKGNGGLYPLYECNRQRQDGLATTPYMSLRCDLLDPLVTRRVLEALQPAQLEIALQAIQQLEQRQATVDRQWRMRLERAAYEAQLAQRRYEEVDPANRLVAATLERRWNEALVKLQQLQEQLAAEQQKQPLAITAAQHAQIRALAHDLPRLWHAPTTQHKDRKRVLRLLLKDITVEKRRDSRQVVLHLRWQGGACEDLSCLAPVPIAERLRYETELVDHVRDLAKAMLDAEIAGVLNAEGRRSAKGKAFSVAMVRWIRYKHRIPAVTRPLDDNELTVKELADRFGISSGVVYYWIRLGLLEVHRIHAGAPYAITLTPQKEGELREWVRQSSRIHRVARGAFQNQTVGGAV